MKVHESRKTIKMIFRLSPRHQFPNFLSALTPLAPGGQLNRQKSDRHTGNSHATKIPIAAASAFSAFIFFLGGGILGLSSAIEFQNVCSPTLSLPAIKERRQHRKVVNVEQKKRGKVWEFDLCVTCIRGTTPNALRTGSIPDMGENSVMEIRFRNSPCMVQGIKKYAKKYFFILHTLMMMLKITCCMKPSCCPSTGMQKGGQEKIPVTRGIQTQTPVRLLCRPLKSEKVLKKVFILFCQTSVRETSAEKTTQKEYIFRVVCPIANAQRQFFFFFTLFILGGLVNHFSSLCV